MATKTLANEVVERIEAQRRNSKDNLEKRVKEAAIAFADEMTKFTVVMTKEEVIARFGSLEFAIAVFNHLRTEGFTVTRINETKRSGFMGLKKTQIDNFNISIGDVK